MKSARQTRNGAKTPSIRDAENTAKRAGVEAKTAKAVFKAAKAKLKLARKAAKHTKKAARKAEKAASRARKTLDRLRKDAKQTAPARVRKKAAPKVAAQGSPAHARRTLRRKTLASLAPGSRTSRPHPATSRPAHSSEVPQPAPAAVPPKGDESDS